MGGVVRGMRKLVGGVLGFGSTPALPAPAAAADLSALGDILVPKSATRTAATIKTEPVEDMVLAPEVEPAPMQEDTLLKKKKQGRYGTILTGKSSLGSADVAKKSLLGS